MIATRPAIERERLRLGIMGCLSLVVAPRLTHSIARVTPAGNLAFGALFQG
jgi:hypothetical protein